MNMRDKIEAIIWDYCKDDEAFADTADAILAALPDMIAPLVWRGVESDCFVSSDLDGARSYELCVYDTLERPCDYLWDVRYVVGQGEIHIPCANPSTLEAAKAAANTHHRAAILATFTEETK